MRLSKYFLSLAFLASGIGCIESPQQPPAPGQQPIPQKPARLSALEVKVRLQEMDAEKLSAIKALAKFSPNFFTTLNEKLGENKIFITPDAALEVYEILKAE